MSAEYRTVPTIPFHIIDRRLERYGIKVHLGGAFTALIGPYGTLCATPDGNSTHFERQLGVDTQAVLDAIETEYGVEVIDENDCRFWGFSNHDEMLEAYCRPQLPSPISTRNWIVVQGPPDGIDAEFAISWLEAALKADIMLEAYFEANPDFRKRLSRLEIGALIEFAPWAMWFMRIFEQNVFALDLFDSELADLFYVMLAAGFFARIDERYQMTVPQALDLAVIQDALIRMAETEDENWFLHPERLLVTMTLKEAETWTRFALAIARNSWRRSG